MKKILCLFLLGKGAFGATIRMEFTGEVDEITVGDLLPVNEPFKFFVDFETPKEAGFVDSNLADYVQIPVNARLEFASNIFIMQEMFVSLELIPNPLTGNFSTNFGTFTPFGNIILPPYRSSNLSLNIESDEAIFDDPTRLPSSLDEWNLNAGSREVVFLFEEGDSAGGELERWGFRSSSISLISLNSIPEPSSILMLTFGAMTLLRRRRQ